MKNTPKLLPIAVFAVVILLIGAYFFIDNSGTNKSKIESYSNETCSAIADSDNLSFDWRQVNTDSEFEICLLELAKNFESPQKMADWLEEQGFSRVGIVSNTSNRLYLNAIWSLESAGSPVPFAANYGFFKHWVAKNYDYRLQVEYVDGTPAHASAMHPML